MRHESKRPFALAGLFALGVLALAQGCGDDDNDNPKPDPVIPVDEGGSGGKGSGGKGNGSGATVGEGGSGATVGEGGSGATVGEGGSGATVGEGGSGPIEPPACTLPEHGDNGCFNCPKDKETEQWLNRCVSGSACVPFDNDRVKLLNADGSLPPFNP